MNRQSDTAQLPPNSSARNYGIDLMRCVAMAMVVTLHNLQRSGLLTQTAVGTLKYEVVWLIEIFCYCAVDCFVIVSGYVGLHSKFRLSRILLLWLQVVFYHAGCTILFQAIGNSWDAVELLRCFLPVSTNAYWFFTHYFALCFFMPFLNRLSLSLSLKQNGMLVGVMLAFFSFLPMLYAFPVHILGEFVENRFFTERGYSFLWMLVLYTIGAFLKRLSEEGALTRIKTKFYLLLYFCSNMVVWMIHFFCVNREEPLSPYFIVAYTSPVIVLSAVGLVLLFQGSSLPHLFKSVLPSSRPAHFPYIFFTLRERFIWSIRSLSLPCSICAF